MKKLIILIAFCLSINAYAFEFEYKRIFLDIPDCEIKSGGIPDLHYAAPSLSGTDWTMTFSDSLFEKDCAFLAKKISTISCTKASRIEMLDLIIDEGDLAAQVIFDVPKGGKVKRQEFNDYILYTSAGPDKYSVAMLVEKSTGRTIDISGKFSSKHLMWLRLKPVP